MVAERGSANRILPSYAAGPLAFADDRGGDEWKTAPNEASMERFTTDS